MLVKKWFFVSVVVALSLSPRTAVLQVESAMAEDTRLNPCKEGLPSEKLLDTLKAQGGELRVDTISPSLILPAGSTLDIIFKKKVEPQTHFRAFAMIGEPGADYKAGDAVLIDGLSIIARPISSEHPLVKSNTVSSTDTSVLSFELPAHLGNLFWSPATLYLFGCGADDTLSSIAMISKPMSSKLYCLVLAIGFVAVAYVMIAISLWMLGTPAPGISTAAKSLGGYLNPVVLTAGGNGKGSLAKLQILFFSLIVCGLLAFIVLRTGILSDLSSKILLLLGIAGVGATAAKATDVRQNRLSSESWVWLIRKNWLPPGGLAAVNEARWRDIVTADGEFDVYRFQMVIFSVVVGLALLSTGLTNLATFEIPETLLGILGLSQVIYIGGKLVAPPSCAEVDGMLTKLRELEANFIKAANQNPDPQPPAGQQPTDPPKDIAAAKRRAKEAYDVYVKAATDTRIMFQSVMGRKVADVDLEPDVR